MRMSLILRQPDLKDKYEILSQKISVIEDGIPDEGEKLELEGYRREIESIYAEALGRLVSEREAKKTGDK